MVRRFSFDETTPTKNCGDYLVLINETEHEGEQDGNK